MNRTTALLGAGCFWTVEATLKQLAGVEHTLCGHIWMTQGLPSLESTQRFSAERMEVVRFTWNLDQLSPEDLVDFILKTSQPDLIDWNNPGDLAHVRHGLFVEEKHRPLLETVVSTQNGRGFFQVLELPHTFVAASAFDQDYHGKRPGDGYCSSIIAPKLDRIRHTFAHLLKNGGPSGVRTHA